MKKYFISLFFLLMYLFGFAFDSHNISFYKIPFKESLPNNTVKKIFQDKQGFIWLGTESGICRYDSYSLNIIKSNIEHPNLLTCGDILCIAQDKQNRIWLGTNRGINVINANNQVVPIIFDQKIQSLRVNGLLCDESGDVWIGTENGIFVYNGEKKTIKSYYHNNSIKSSLPGNNITSIFKDKSGCIWVTAWNKGLCRFEKKSNSFEAMPQLGRSNNPNTIFQDADGVFWIGTFRDGLFRMELDKNKANPIFSQCLISNVNSLNNIRNSVTSIVQDKFSGNLWILSPDGIRIIFDKKNMKFESVNLLNVFENASNSLGQLMSDSQGCIWIATANDGVYIANPRKPLFTLNRLKNINNSRGFINVSSFIENGNEIWLGLINFGVYLIDKNAHDASAEAQPIFNEENQIMSTIINCFCKDKTDGSLWVGGMNFLVKIYKKNNVYQYEELWGLLAKLISKEKGSVTSLYCDSKKRMWIGTRKGLVLKSGNGVKLISTEYNNVNCIVENRSGDFWVGSPSKGLLHLKEQKDEHFIASNYIIANGKINSDEINVILSDKNGVVWVGTNNGGLNKYDKSGDRFVCQNRQYQIFEEDIKGIVEDAHGYLWLSSINKIIKVDVRKKISTLLSSDDISKINSFNPSACYKDSKGRLYFGGGNGYCSLYPDSIKQVSETKNVVISDVLINNKSIFDGSIRNNYDPANKTLILNYKQRTVGFEISALNYISPNSINYAYKLDGVDKDWVYVNSKRRYVNYNQLSKGEYVFQFKSTDQNGEWIERINHLKIIIEPAPYETWWAYVLYIFLVSAILYIVYKTILNRIRLKRDLMISEIRQERSEELTQMKLQYFTNISHELLTPLTIISCLIEDFNYNFPSKFKQYTVMKSNVTRLKRLLQQILDFRKVESGNMKLNIKEGDLMEFIQSICQNTFDTLATKMQINFSILAPKVLNASFDADKIDKILFNILSNAFKYTSEKGSISLKVQSVIKNEIHFVQLLISDTGIGIEPERLPYIFDRFYGNELRTDSNGIGLSLTKELVEIHKGTITVRSQLNVGTSFSVEIPIDANFYTLKERETQSDVNKINVELLLDGNDELSLPNINPATAKNSEVSLLLVEDNDDLRMVLYNSLSNRYNTLQAANGVEALKMIKDNEIDIVISDIMMPEMDGLTLCKTIKADVNYSHTAILLLTAKNQIEDRVECYNAGADAYVSKPFEMEVLIARLGSLIRNRQKRNEEYQTSLYINPKNYENDSIDGIFLRESIKIVEDNLSDFNFSHEQLIKSMNTTKSTFYRKIKSLTGLAPNEFVRNIRLKHACLMLQSETGNISDIAYSVGFSDPKYFSTCFKSEFGISPSEYVKKKTS